MAKLFAFLLIAMFAIIMMTTNVEAGEDFSDFFSYQV